MLPNCPKLREITHKCRENWRQKKSLILGEITQTCFCPSSNHINKMHLKI